MRLSEYHHHHNLTILRQSSRSWTIQRKEIATAGPRQENAFEERIVHSPILPDLADNLPENRLRRRVRVVGELIERPVRVAKICVSGGQRALHLRGHGHPPQHHEIPQMAGHRRRFHQSPPREENHHLAIQTNHLARTLPPPVNVHEETNAIFGTHPNADFSVHLLDAIMTRVHSYMWLDLLQSAEEEQRHEARSW